MINEANKLLGGTTFFYQITNIYATDNVRQKWDKRMNDAIDSCKQLRKKICIPMKNAGTNKESKVKGNFNSTYDRISYQNMFRQHAGVRIQETNFDTHPQFHFFE